jgi:L-ascorbate 6-phosphate lactonase
MQQGSHGSRIRANERLIDEMNATTPPYGTLAIWLLGQESIVVKGDGILLYFDPFVSDDVRSKLGLQRLYEPPLVPADITNAAVSLITHDHEDHLDAGTMKVICHSSPDSLVVVPKYCASTIVELGFAPHRVFNAHTEEPLSLLGDRLQVWSIPAMHEQFEVDAGGEHRYVGYVIRLNGVTLYHAGDTLVYDGLAARLRSACIDVACLPINGRDYYRASRNIAGNMNYREAAELSWEIGADTVIPLHYDTFDWNTEKPGSFVQYVYEQYPEQKCHLLARGERFLYVSSSAFKNENEPRER